MSSVFLNYFVKFQRCKNIQLLFIISFYEIYFSIFTNIFLQALERNGSFSFFGLVSCGLAKTKPACGTGRCAICAVGFYFNIFL